MNDLIECPCCGMDAEHYSLGGDFELLPCPFCGEDKCSACNFGDDVPCMGCEEE